MQTISVIIGAGSLVQAGNGFLATSTWCEPRLTLALAVQLTTGQRDRPFGNQENEARIGQCSIQTQKSKPT
jgi:hypothetical protein